MEVTENSNRQESLLRLTEQFQGTDTVKFTEAVTKKPYETLSEEGKIEALTFANEKLMLANQLLWTKYKQGQVKVDIKDTDLQIETQRAIRLTQLIIKIQAWWRGCLIRKKLQGKIQILKTEEFTNLDREKDLFQYLNNDLITKGLTLESLYRVCDTTEKSVVAHQDFIDCIKRLKIPLKEVQVKRIIMLIDEDCTGYLRYDDYAQTIEAFGFKSNKYKSGSYRKECMGKLFGVLLKRSIEPQEFCSMCESNDNTNTIRINDIRRILNGLNVGFYQREIRAICAYLDQKGTDKITKDELLSSLKFAEEAWKQSARKPVLAWAPDSGILAFSVNPDLKRSAVEIIAKMESTGISVEELVESFGDQFLISLGKVITKLTYCYPELTKEERITFGKFIPLNEGMVNLHELLVFLHQFSQGKKEKPVNVYFQFWANCINGTLGMSPAEYFRKEGIVDEIDYVNFVEKGKMAIGLGENVYKMMWQSLIAEDEESVSLEDLLTVLESYVGISSQKEAAAKTDFAKILANRSMTLEDVFKLACADLGESNDKAPAIGLLRAFKKIAPEIDPELIRIRFKENEINDLVIQLTLPQFVNAFSQSNLKETSPERALSKNPLYWINKIDQIMLDLGLSPTAMFRKSDLNNDGVISIKELGTIFTSVVTSDRISSRELLEMLNAFDTNRSGVIEFEEFVDLFKKARSASSLTNIGSNKRVNNKKLPIYGNLIFVKLGALNNGMRAPIIQEIVNKILRSSVSFMELVEFLKWDQEGRVMTNKFMSDLEEFFGSTLSNSDRYALCQHIDKERLGYITIQALLRFYNNDLNLDDDYQRLVKLDMLVLILAFKKSKKDTIEEFLDSFGLTPLKKLSHGFFSEFLMQNFGLTEKSASRLIDHFKEGNDDSPLMLIQWVIDKLNEYVQTLQSIPSDTINDAKAEKVFVEIACKIKKEKHADFLNYLNSIGFRNMLDPVSEEDFVARLSISLGIPQDQLSMAYKMLMTTMKSGYPIIGATVLDKLKKSYANYNEQVTAKLEQQVTELIKLKENNGIEINQVFAKTTPNPSRTISKNELEKLLKRNYEGITQKEVDTVINVLSITKSGDITVIELQNFLRKYSPSRNPSVDLEMRFFVSVAKNNFGSIEKMLENSNIELTAKYDKVTFMNKVIQELSIDNGVGEIIYDKLSKAGVCSVADFVTFVQTFDPSPIIKKDSDKEESKSELSNLVKTLEKRHPLLDIFDSLSFNNQDCVSIDNFISAASKTWTGVKSEEFRELVTYLDNENKGSISFISVMQLVKEHSENTKYPDVETMCMEIAKTLNKQARTMKEYMEEHKIKSEDNISVKVYIDKVMPPFKFRNKDAYYLYDQLREDSQLLTSILIARIEKMRKELPKDNTGTKISIDQVKSIIKNSLIGKSLPVAVVDFYEQLFSHKTKKRMNEATVFRILDTDGNGIITKPEFIKGMTRLRVKIPNDQLEEVFDFADQGQNGQVTAENFMDMVRFARERVAAQEISKITQGLGKTPEEMYKDTMEKVKWFAANHKDEILNYDYKFQMRGDKEEPVIPRNMFESALRGLSIGLSEEEIQVIVQGTDLDKDGVINNDEFMNYLNLVDIHEVPRVLLMMKKNEVDKSKEEHKVPPEFLQNAQILKQHTNFRKYDDTDIPIEKVIELIDTPYSNYVIDCEKDFSKVDRFTGKRKATIVNSREAAILCAEFFFRRLKVNEKFTDPEFGPTTHDPTGGYSLYPDGNPPKPNLINPSEVCWLRPNEISSKPRFMDIEGLNAGDVIQGELGDCWFISALSSIAANNENSIMSNMDPIVLEKLTTGQSLTRGMWECLDESLFSPIFHYYATKGMYVIKFMKDYEWNYVIMDDKLPCRSDKVPVYAKSKNLQEFWVSLVEKAYAKLHGCYYNLTSGFIHEALTDLTGSTPLRMELNNIKEDNEPTPAMIEDFWNQLCAWNENAMMGCSVKGAAEGPIRINGIPTGILSGHAYSILDLFKIDKNGGKGKSRLLRIRNPWGDTEWRGKWADDSEQIEENKDKIKSHYKTVRREVCFSSYRIKLANMEKWVEDPIDDGNFLMCYKDWRELFTTMYICRNFFHDNEHRAVRFPYCLTTENNGGTPIHGTEEECEEWGKNPFAKISVRETSVTMHICVAQEDPRIKEKGTFPYTGILHPFCFTILQCEGVLQSTVPVFDQDKISFISSITNQREITAMHNFTPGNYVIVPSTKEPELEGNFWITIFYPTSTSAKIGFDFSDPNAHRIDLPIEINDPYELCDDKFQEFVAKRKNYFLFSQVIDRGDRDASFRLDRSSSKLVFNSPKRSKVPL